MSYENGSRIGEPFRGYYLTAYSIAVKHGFVGDEAAWLASLTAYGIAVKHGYVGTEEEWIASLKLNFSDLTDDEKKDIALRALDAASEEAVEAILEAKEEAVAAMELAESARDDAVTAKGTAVSAKDTAVSAKEAAISAKADAVLAKTAAEGAASSAQTSASTASTAASSAQTSASTASTAASSAQASASTASSAASSAQASASTASTAKTAASEAKTNAEFAAATAENESLLAQSAATSAVAAKNAAVNASTEAKAYAKEIKDLTVSAEELPAGSTPTVTKTGGGAVPYNLNFGIPKGGVSSVNGQTGDITLDAGDIGAVAVADYNAKIAELEKKNRKQDFDISDLKNIVYDTVVDDAEHTFASLDISEFPTHISDGEDYHKVFDGAELMMSKIKGRTSKYNQLATHVEGGRRPIDMFRYSASNCTYEITDDIYTQVITVSTTEYKGCVYKNITPVAGHKYFISVKARCSEDVTLQIREFAGMTRQYPQLAANTWSVVSFIVTANSTENRLMLCYYTSLSVGARIDYTELQVVDLTNIYGAGNEPATVDAFLAEFSAFGGFVSHAAEKIKTAELDGIKVRGSNQWNEAWEVGTIDVSGNNADSATEIRSRDYIGIIGGTPYYIGVPAVAVVHAYRADKSYIGNYYFGEAGTYTFPSDARYIRFRMSDTYGTDYNNDIFICIGSTGTYKPYAEFALDFGDTQVLGSVGDVCDEIAVEDGGADLFDVKRYKRTEARAYEDGDEDDPDCVTDGVTTVAILAEPSVTTLMSGLAEDEVACLTEKNGSIEVVGNDNAGLANPDVNVIMQVEKAVETV